MKIEHGCFKAEELSPGRWRVVNTLTTFEYVTYGEADDVRATLERQSTYWTQRFADAAAKKPGKRAQEKWSQNRTLAPVKKSPFVPGGAKSSGS